MLIPIKNWKKTTIIIFISIIILLNIAYFIFYENNFNNYKQKNEEYELRIKPIKQITEQELINSAKIIKNRLHNEGYLSTKYTIKNQEIKYKTEQEIREETKIQILKPGIFEGKIGEKTVLTPADISYVQTIGQNAGIQECEEKEETICTYKILVSLGRNSASKLGQIINNLTVIETETKYYLSDNLTLFVDNKVIQEIMLTPELKGQVLTEIIISGKEKGNPIEDARENALKSMKKIHSTLTTPALTHEFYVVE